MSIKRLQKLKNKARRDLFVSGQIKTGIPFQIRAMRDKKNWTQAQLGTELGMTQTNISRLESPGYGRLNITTLQRIASVFDVALVVRFVPFSELLRWTNNLSPQAMAPASFEEEIDSLEKEAASLVTSYAQPVKVSAIPGTVMYHVADTTLYWPTETLPGAVAVGDTYYTMAPTFKEAQDIIITWKEPSKETTKPIEETDAPTSLIDLLKAGISDTNIIDYSAQKEQRAA